MKKRLVIAGIFGLIFFPCSAFAIAAWPDTGQDRCYNNYVQITCPQPGQPFYGQDAQHQGIQPSYTKLDASGNDLPDSANVWSMVRDNVTGLTWEVKTDDGSVHDRDITYTWCDSTAPYPGDCANQPNTEVFIDDLNKSRFGNQSDWRLPAIEELATLISPTHLQQVVNIDYFPFLDKSLLSQYNYWSSSTSAEDSFEAWLVSYDPISFSPEHKYYGYYGIMAVRGGALPKNRFVNNHNGTTTDTVTGLIWQQDTAIIDGGTEPDLISWDKALDYVKNQNNQKFAGYSDWRLPNINELIALLDFSQIRPLLDPSLVPQSSNALPYISSTTYIYNDDAWGIYFVYGGFANFHKAIGWYVRMVRSGKKLAYSLTVSRVGNGIGIVKSSPAGINCGSDCSEAYDSGTTVNLTTYPSANSIFTGWSGDCSGTGTCVVKINSNKYVSANFEDPSFVPTLSPIYYLLRENIP